jgi:hypothetical protein
MHSITKEESEEERKGLKGKLIAFFDIEEDPLVKGIKNRMNPPEKKEEWVYTK